MDARALGQGGLGTGYGRQAETVGADRGATLAAAHGEENVACYLAEGTVRKEIAVPGRLGDFVVA